MKNKTFSGLLLCILAFSLYSQSGEYSMDFHKSGVPFIVESQYPMENLIVAEFSVIDFGADPSGETDSTEAFQAALDSSYANGGGVVWIPSGKYRITSTVIIPSNTNLMGDWQDPDSGKDYGTVIIADMPSGTDPLFDIGGVAGASGLTVFYPNQNAIEPVEYGWAFEIRGNGFHDGTGYHASSVDRITLINAYRGIGINAPPFEANVHELVRTSSIKGTVLYRGMDMRNCADVSSHREIYFNNKYWSDAPAEYNPPEKSTIDAFTRREGVGMTIADVEWDNFFDIKISDYKTGIHLIAGSRISFAGQFIGAEIHNTDIAVLADKKAIDSRSPTFGISFAMSSLQGDRAVIENNSKGFVSLAQTVVNGPMPRTFDHDVSKLGLFLGRLFSDRVFVDERKLDIPLYEVPHPVRSVSRRVLYDVSQAPYNTPYTLGKIPEVDAGIAIQQAINDAAAEGGGVVYLTAGWYLLKTPLEIPVGVELKGSAANINRSQHKSNGTVLFLKPNYNAASVTISGNNAGVSGIRFFYPDNSYREKGGFKVLPPAIKLRGAENCWVENVSIDNGYKGLIAEDGSDHLFLHNLVGSTTHGFIAIKDSIGGRIEECHVNPNFWTRHSYGLDPFLKDGDKDLYWKEFVPQRKISDTIISLVNVRDQTILSSFGYAVQYGVYAENSTVKIYNIGTDNTGEQTVFADDKSDVIVVNSLNWGDPTSIIGVSHYLNKGEL